MPYLLKDTMASKGDPHTAAINGVRKAGYRVGQDAYFVERMRDAGFGLVGRSNTSELALVSTTESVAWGWCRNPWIWTCPPAAPAGVPANVSGQPSISLPLHWTPDGLPIGVQLTAAYGREEVLIQVASQLETAMPWGGRRPPHSV